MPRINLDIDVLRTLVTGIELGSFAKASDRIGRSTSALSAQMKKLEAQIGKPVLRRSGRGLVLTPIGELVIAYARRILSLNDEVIHTVRHSMPATGVRFGVLEDFGDRTLTNVLRRMSFSCKDLDIQVEVARQSELLERIASGKLDFALAWSNDALETRGHLLARLPLCWFGREGSDIKCTPGETIQLAMLDPPCPLTTLATTKLEKAGIPWRISFTSPNLAGVWAAVDAGIGVTVRTPAGLPRRLCALAGLPALPSIGLALYQSESLSDPTVTKLVELVGDSLADAW
jgi:DNA-binding transcriptional LysR family regulator